MLAVAGIVALHADARYVYDGLTGDGLPLVILSLACGAAVLVMLARGMRRGARPLAVVAVVAVVWGWGVAQHPYLLPQVLTIDAGAAPSATLTALLIVFGAAVVLVLPVDRAAVHARPAERGRGVPGSPSADATLMPTEDHHSAYIARAVAALTPEGHARVDELLEQLARVAGRREWLVRFAKAREAEAEGTAIVADPVRMLGDDDLYALILGFKTIRDEEPLDDVTDWANAVLALLQDERARD